MIDKICDFILKKMKKKMPEITEEQSEIIAYGLKLIIGEIPKTLLLFVLAFILGVGWYMVFAYIVIMPYRVVSGGIHLHTHLGCLISSGIMYYGNIYLSKYLYITDAQKYIIVGLTFIFGILMISWYAPADTENVPIISKRERKTKKILSYITFTLTLIAAILISDNTLSNILIFGTIIQTVMITRLAYELTNNKYGHEVYANQ